MELTVRAGTIEDLPAIVALYNHYVETSAATFDLCPVSVEDRIAWLAAHSRGMRHRLLVADGPEGKVMGWATTSPFRPRDAYATTVEASVYCRPGSRGHGVGSRLYADLFRAIAHEDVERVVAGVTLPNPASVALHRRFDFRHVGTFTRVGRKFGRYWDVAWFERPLLGPEGPGRDPSGRSGPTRGPDQPAAPGERL